MYSYQRLKSFARSIFCKIGCPENDAESAADSLLAADLRGVDSHGVARLSGYVRLWEIGRINPRPETKLVHQTPSTAVVDGDRGLGLVVAPRAMEIAVEKASACGSGWVAVRNGTHFGIAGYHAMIALKNDMVGLAMTNATPTTAPTFSTERLLGTNPIAVAVPAGDEPPFVADFATTTAAHGKLEILQRQGESAPLGWVQDSRGRPTADPHALRHGGALLPLGGDPEHGSHKGFCLGSTVDILSAVLSGANYGPWAPAFGGFLATAEEEVGAGLGHFLGALRIDAFRPAGEFKTHMDGWIRRFRSSATVQGQDRVVIPGDPERECEKKRIKEGIPLDPEVEQDLRELAEKFKVEL